MPRGHKAYSLLKEQSKRLDAPLSPQRVALLTALRHVVGTSPESLSQDAMPLLKRLDELPRPIQEKKD